MWHHWIEKQLNFLYILKKQGKTERTWVTSKRMAILMRLHIISQRQSYFETTSGFEQNKATCLNLSWWSFRRWKDWQISKTPRTYVWLWQMKSVINNTICRYKYWQHQLTESYGTVHNEDVWAELDYGFLVLKDFLKRGDWEALYYVDCCFTKWKSPHLSGYEIIYCVDKRLSRVN